LSACFLALKFITAYCTRVIETHFLMRSVAKWFGRRRAATAQGCPPLYAWHVLFRAINIEVTGHIQWPISGDVYRVFGWRTFFNDHAIRTRPGQRTCRASAHNIFRFLRACQVRIAPGFPPSNKKIACSTATFTNVDAQPGIPGYGCLFTFVLDYFLSHFAPE
jgi:hypothetical protein